jgi:hypothetical protein
VDQPDVFISGITKPAYPRWSPASLRPNSRACYDESGSDLEDRPSLEGIDTICPPCSHPARFRRRWQVELGRLRGPDRHSLDPVFQNTTRLHNRPFQVDVFRLRCTMSWRAVSAVSAGQHLPTNMTLGCGWLQLKVLYDSEWSLPSVSGAGLQLLIAPPEHTVFLCFNSTYKCASTT